MENNENVEIFEDEEVITLYDEQDNPVDFAEIACVEYEGKFYALLQPIDEVEGMEEDEVIICLLEQQDDETELITPVTDEELGEKIFEEYLKAVANEDCCDDEGCCCEDGDCKEDDCEGECGKEKAAQKMNEKTKKSGCGCGCGEHKK